MWLEILAEIGLALYAFIVGYMLERLEPFDDIEFRIGKKVVHEFYNTNAERIALIFVCILWPLSFSVCIVSSLIDKIKELK